MFIQVGMASGRPIFDQFEVPTPRKVVSYVGEGGYKEYTRRMERICEAVGISADDIGSDIRPTIPVSSGRQSQVPANVAPGSGEVRTRSGQALPFVRLPWGTEINSANLHQEGSLLIRVSGPCMEAESSLPYK